MQVRRTGINRTVLLIGRWAVKVPSLRGGSTGGVRGRVHTFARGILANASEYQWHDFEGWHGKVAPVLHSWLGGLVQVYPRCEPLSDDDRGPLPRLEPCPGDVKPDNYGRLNGRVVRLDYDMTGERVCGMACCRPRAYARRP